MSRSLQQNLPPMPLETVQVRSQTVPNRVQEWRALVPQALGKAGVSQKAACADLGITAGQFSAQLSGREGEHLSFWRMHALPKEFWQELVLLLIDFHGLTVGSSQRDQEDAAIGRCVREAVLRVVGR